MEKEPNKNQKEMKLENISMSQSGHKVFVSISETGEVAFYCFFIMRQLDKLDSDQNA